MADFPEDLVATEATLAALSAKVTACNTGACVVSSSALPSGAATSAAQTAAQTSLSSMDGKITACNTGAVVVSSSALPALAATSTKQSDGSQKTQVVDASGNVQPSGDAVGRALFTKTTDGTNTAAVKAASTAAAATDPSFVVQTSPNDPNLASPTVNSTPAALTASSSATAFASQAVTYGVRIQADTSNTTSVRIGDSAITTSRGIQLSPGKSQFFACKNANQLYYIAESGSPKINIIHQ